MLFSNLIMICRQRLCFSARLKNRGFRVREIEIQWHKSNETPRTDPENTGSKKKQIFWFSLGVLHGFSQKSKEDEFSQKANGGWIFLGIKWGFCKEKTHRAKKKAIFLVFLGGFAWIFTEIKRG